MGTFTKSVGAVGGYIAADKAVIDYIRKESIGNLYSTSMPPACAAQILAALDVMEGRDGSDIGKKKLQKLRENSKYFYENVKKMGFDVIGDDGSPVYCILLYSPCKMIMFARELLKRGVSYFYLLTFLSGCCCYCRITCCTNE
jgi:serine palmitoyltransferase